MASFLKWKRGTFGTRSANVGTLFKCEVCPDEGKFYALVSDQTLKAAFDTVDAAKKAAEAAAEAAEDYVWYGF
jgi:hypothetical protein